MSWCSISNHSKKEKYLIMKKKYLCSLALACIHALAMDRPPNKRFLCKQLPPEMWQLVVHKIVATSAHQQEALRTIHAFKAVDKKSYHLIAHNKNKLITLIDHKEQHIPCLKKCLIRIGSILERLSHSLEPSDSSRATPRITWQR